MKREVVTTGWFFKDYRMIVYMSIAQDVPIRMLLRKLNF